MIHNFHYPILKLDNLNSNTFLRNVPQTIHAVTTIYYKGIAKKAGIKVRRDHERDLTTVRFSKL